MSNQTEFNQKIIDLQNRFKSPKNIHNEYGGFNYRNFEQMCEVIKPILKELNLLMTVSDEILSFNGASYVKSTIIISSEKDSIIGTTTVREETTNKKMSEPQRTCASISQARKYALCGILLVDDGVDADSSNTGEDLKEGKKSEKSIKDYEIKINGETPLSEIKKILDSFISIEQYYKFRDLNISFLKAHQKTLAPMFNEAKEKLTK